MQNAKMDHKLKTWWPYKNNTRV